jgi:hypothetical protein
MAWQDRRRLSARHIETGRSCGAARWGRSPGELTRSPGRRARSAQRHISIAKQIRVAPARDHRIECLADAAVSRMSPQAEAQAKPAPHRLPSAIYHRPDIRAVRHLRDRIEGRPQALKRISHGLPDLPSGLCEGVGERGVPVIGHESILSLAKAQSQCTFAQLRHLSDALR